MINFYPKIWCWNLLASYTMNIWIETFANVSINKAFKTWMKEEWNNWMPQEDFVMNTNGRRKRKTFLQMCMWVKNSWDKMRSDIVIKSFKKCSVSDTMGSRLTFFLVVRLNPVMKCLISFQAIMKAMKILEILKYTK